MSVDGNIVVDRGPWSVGNDAGGSHPTYVQSNDFAHDVRLYVNGDFAGEERRVAYAQGVADRLNAAPASLSTEPAIKDHELREMVNDLRDAAIKHGITESLRDRLAAVVHRYVRPTAAPASPSAAVVDGEAISDAAVEAVVRLYYGKEQLGGMIGDNVRATVRRDLAAALPHLSAPLYAAPASPSAADWIHAETLAVLRNMDTELRATGRVSARIERLINVIAGSKPVAAPVSPSAAVVLEGEPQDLDHVQAARYRWWRENAGWIAEDGDGIVGCAWSCQISADDINVKNDDELMDMIADHHLAQLAKQAGATP